MPLPHPALTEARELGRTRYFTGVPCAHGHLCERHTTNSTCVVCSTERAAKWAQQFPEKSAEKSRRWSDKPENKLATKTRTRVWRKKNRDRLREAHAKWCRENPSRVRASVVSKQLAKRNAVPKWLTKEHKEEIHKTYKLCRKMSASSGILHHVDHIVPIVNPIVCGLHVPWNLRILTGSENSSKNNKFIEELAMRPLENNYV